MSTVNLPYILQRKCKDKSGIRFTEEYLGSFWTRSSRPPPDSEEAYQQIVNDFLSKDLANTSEPVIPDSFAKEDRDTFPPGHLRHGGGVVLQIQDTVDIRYSALSQLNQLTNAAPVRQVYVERNEEAEIQLTRGILRWTLTDGHCQIQAMELEPIPGLTLLTPLGCKDSIKVLGGEVPEMFGGNMLKETIQRLKEKLGLAPSSNIPASVSTAVMPIPLPAAAPPQEPIPDSDYFDDDDDLDYAQLEAMETDHIVQEDILMSDLSFDSNLLNEDTTRNTIFSTKKAAYDSDSDVFVDAADTPYRSTQSTNTKVAITSLSKKPQSTSRRTNVGKLKETAIATKTLSSKHIMSDTVDLTNDDPGKSTQTELEEVSWIDSSIWDDLSEAAQEKEEGIHVDNQGRTHLTFTKIQQILKDMENNCYRTDLPDTVIVRARCVQFGKLVTSNRFYSLVLYFDDPEQPTNNPIQVIFSNDILSKLLNAKRQDVVNVNTAGGHKAVLRQIFMPFDKKVRNAIANIEIDLSITEKGDSSFLMPMGIDYEGIPSQAIL
ncbi:hypothetical protein BY458DRAFT_432875 [Sporodiniella umbellata]|nr:hypothetical protein BY458DRAFT_432875 [Sporodiniella umbellata]